MTPEELYDRMRKELEEMRALYREGTNALHEEIKNMTEPAPAGGEKLYTTSEIIQLVQEIVSEEICGLDDGGMLVAYEVEWEIVAKLVQEGANERKSRESEIRRSHTGRKRNCKSRLQATTAPTCRKQRWIKELHDVETELEAHEEE